MKIEELNGQRAKICRDSIRITGENGKTAGVITQAHELQARESSQIWSIYRAAIGTDAAGAIKKTRRINGKYIFLANIKSEKERAQAEALQAAGIATALYYPD